MDPSSTTSSKSTAKRPATVKDVPLDEIHSSAKIKEMLELLCDESVSVLFFARVYLSLMSALMSALTGALIGALVGALTGALVGALTGALVGALMGALVGALIGALIGALVGALSGFYGALPNAHFYRRALCAQIPFTFNNRRALSLSLWSSLSLSLWSSLSLSLWSSLKDFAVKHLQLYLILINAR